MDPALTKALGELLLNAVPTIIIFLGLVTAYNFLVHRPLVRLLEERRRRTEGALAQAQAEIARADAKAAEYGQRLREARADIFHQQEAARRKKAEARAAALAAARAAAQERVKVARAAIEKETAEAKAGLQSQVEQLARQVIQTVLRSGTATAGGR
jgi:F-type H+-transporting ATPase subunit b